MERAFYPSLLDLCAQSSINPLLLSQAIEQGQNVNMKDHRGLSPLLLVCMYTTENPLQAIQCLLKSGANLYDRDLHGNSALHIAISSASPLVPALLADPNLLQSVNDLKQTPLHIAASSSNIPVIVPLIESIPIDSIDARGYTPLVSALSQNHGST